jgi:hypothetical protein
MILLLPLVNDNGNDDESTTTSTTATATNTERTTPMTVIAGEDLKPIFFLDSIQWRPALPPPADAMEMFT